jgi:hypothetical protein
LATNKQVDREKGSHGQLWDTLHGGYFASPEAACPLLKTVREAIDAAGPDVVLDLGGGTGFLLSQLVVQDGGQGMVLVNLDCSAAQLSAAERRGIACCSASVSDFRRGVAAPEEKRFLFVMRSVLHYFGEKGLSPVLQHIRSQARKGELFVHQTACFENAGEAACLNALYAKMRTGKWYPTVAELRRRMAGAGWDLIAVVAAPPLRLTSADLAERYALAPDQIARIREGLAREFGETEGVFQPLPQGFLASLHYRIFVCAAGPD